LHYRLGVMLDRISALAAMLFDAPMSGVVVNGTLESSLGPTLEVDASRLTVDHEPMEQAPYAHFRVAVPFEGGTLYVADTRARQATEKQLEGLINLAAMAAGELESRRTVAVAEEAKQKLTEARDQLAQLVTTDELTGIANKRGLNQRLQLLGAEGERGRRFAVAMVDIDHFKKLNDTYGHAEGDRVLRLVAQTLQHAVRKTDFVARFGGEEFCVLFTDVDGPTALQLAERLRATVAALPERVTASFGVALCSDPSRADVAALLESADQALYRAKRAGRNKVAMARRTMPSATLKKVQRAAA
jgi:diguanylate cyclase (GGDEF)-like protein